MTVALSEQQARLYDFIRSWGGVCPSRAIAKHIGIHPQQVYCRAMALVEKGIIEKAGKALWCAVDAEVQAHSEAELRRLRSLKGAANHTAESGVKRPCITCGRKMVSAGHHNRMCVTCRHRSINPYEDSHKVTR